MRRLSQAHQALVDCDSNQPCVKLRVPLKLIELFVRLEERVLHHVFGIFAVLRDVLRNPEDLPLILADQRIVSRDITSAYPLDQGYVGVLLVFSCNRLDGRHGSWMRNSLGIGDGRFASKRPQNEQCTGARAGGQTGVVPLWEDKESMTQKWQSASITREVRHCSPAGFPLTLKP